VSAQPYAAPSRWAVLADELAKLPAFLRRDFLNALSYRLAFVTDWFGLLIQAVTISFVGVLVGHSADLPTYGGQPVSYMQFAVIGVALAGFVSLALGRVAMGIRNEQLIGTLESLLVTPTSTKTIQLGSVLYDLMFIPIRTALFLLVTGLLFGLDFYASGVVPALVVLLALLPFVWGIGVATAGLVLTFRRGTVILGFGTAVLTLLSGTVFPLSLLPHWLEVVARINPLAIAIESIRQSLLGGTGFAEALIAVAKLAPFSALSLAAGLWVFALALRRERRHGTIGLY
jgi:ABC-2 type transport system permease protein